MRPSEQSGDTGGKAKRLMEAARVRATESDSRERHLHRRRRASSFSDLSSNTRSTDAERNQGIRDRRRGPGPKPIVRFENGSVVRVEAGRLRDRLREYYDQHGPADDVLISVPKGGYVPEFSERQPPAQPQIRNVLWLSLLPPESAASIPSSSHQTAGESILRRRATGE